MPLVKAGQIVFDSPLPKCTIPCPSETGCCDTRSLRVGRQHPVWKGSLPMADAVLRNRTTLERPETAAHDWWLVDADGEILGRLAARIATVLCGKHKPGYTPHVDTGDFVVVVNAGKIRVTGKKMQQKTYHKYSGYIGGLKEHTLEEMLRKNPCKVIELATKRMLPKNRLGRKMFKKLKVYAGPEHPHAPQAPQPLEIDARKVVS